MITPSEARILSSNIESLVNKKLPEVEDEIRKSAQLAKTNTMVLFETEKLLKATEIRLKNMGYYTSRSTGNRLSISW
jgi:hypothetical protein